MVGCIRETVEHIDALEFAASLMESQVHQSHAVLVVVCTRDEALAERPQERALLEGLLEDDHVTRLMLGPLAPEDFDTDIAILGEALQELRSHV